MKKLFVNKDACIGCGACVAIDGEHFDFDDDGLSHVISDENIESDEAHNAISSCPTSAISYVESVEDETSEKDCACENCDGESCCHKHNELDDLEAA